MNDLQLHKEIVARLKQHLAPAVLAKLLRDLRQSNAVEWRLLGATGTRELSLTGHDTLDHVVTFCSAALQPWDAANVTIGIGDIFRDNGDLSRAEELYTFAILHCKDEKRGGAAGESYLRRGDLYSRQGRWKESAADLNHSRRICRARNDKAGIARVDNILGTNFALQGNLKKAKAYYARALSAFERVGEKSMIGTVLMNVGIVHNILGRYGDALGYYRRARQYFDKLGDVERLMELHHNIAMSYLSKEMHNEALHHFDSCIMYASRLHKVNVLAIASLGKAVAGYQMHDHKLALVLANQALHLFNECNDRNGLADAYKVKGMIHRAMKQFGTSASLFQTSLRLNAELKNELNSGETQFEIGVLERMRGNPPRAAEAFAQALKHFRKVGAAKEIDRTRLELTNILSNKKMGQKKP